MFASLMISTLAALGPTSPAGAPPGRPEVELDGRSLVPFDRANPVLYDNDDHRDMRTDEYLLALASAGTIRLEGIVTTYSADRAEYDLFVPGRREIVARARRSGFRDLPDPVAGPNVRLDRPRSNRIEETKALGGAGGRAIAAAAGRASVERPLVVVTGGQLTAVADAYLIDPTIAPKVIVCGIFGALDRTYNAGLDPWAWAIVLAKFRCVSISDSETRYNEAFMTARPRTPKARFAEGLRSGVLPPTELHRSLAVKRHPAQPPAFMEQDGDALAAIPLVRPDVITGVERYRCVELRPDGMPHLVRDDDGPIFVVVHADREIATREFWRAIEDPASWGKGR